jgi:hypothetical protein
MFGGKNFWPEIQNDILHDKVKKKYFSYHVSFSFAFSFYKIKKRYIIDGKAGVPYIRRSRITL